MLSGQLFGPGGDTTPEYWIDGRPIRAAWKAPQRKRQCHSRALSVDPKYSRRSAPERGTRSWLKAARRRIVEGACSANTAPMNRVCSRRHSQIVACERCIQMEDQAMSLIRTGYAMSKRGGFLGAAFSALLTLALLGPGAVAAQDVKQIKLTEKHIQGFIAAS